MYVWTRPLVAYVTVGQVEYVSTGFQVEDVTTGSLVRYACMKKITSQARVYEENYYRVCKKRTTTRVRKNRSTSRACKNWTTSKVRMYEQDH